MNKINVLGIVAGHFRTLKNHRTGKVSVGDVFLFYIVPAIFVIVFYFAERDLSKDLVNIVVTAGSIFTALLLNLLILVYDQKSKLNSLPNSGDGLVQNSRSLRGQILNESYYNIAYCTIFSLIIVFFCVIHMYFFKVVWQIDVPTGEVYKFKPSLQLISPIIVYIGIHLLLSLLMVIKRIFLLMQTED